MRKFFVYLTDKNKDIMSKSLILGHVAHLREMKLKGVLDFCGPCHNGDAIMIYSADTIEEAQAYVDADPFSKNDYYRSRKITEVEEATIENNFHLDEVLDFLDKK